MVASQVSLFLREAISGDAVVLASSPEPRSMRIPSGEGIVGAVLRMDRVLCWPGESPEPGLGTATSQTVMAAPVRRGGRPIGVLVCVDSPLRPRDRSRAIALARAMEPLLTFPPEPATSPCQPLSCGGLVGRSPALVLALDRAARAAPTDVTVLITGETGTGKEGLARAIHDNSKRARAPFVKIDCGSIPENLVESTLFGHERGAFTGAVAEQTGQFEAARGGTVFLDEIAELPMTAQTRLLRVIEDRVVQRVGSHRSLPVEFRIVAATHRDLGARMAEGLFREDLYHRIRVVSVHLPPLRARGDADLMLLVDHLARKHASRHGLPLHCIPAATQALLGAHDWPGNVRELSHAIESALVLSPDGVLSPDLFTLEPSPPGTGPFEDEPTVDRLMDRYIRWLMIRYNGQKAQVAEVAGISRSTLWRLLKEPKDEASMGRILFPPQCSCSASERMARSSAEDGCCQQEA